MAKWNYALAGSSCHIHASLWDKTGKKPLFFDPKAKHTMSNTMRQFVAGQLKYADDITVPGALREFLQAFPGRHLRADQGDLEPRQPHRRLPPLRPEEHTPELQPQMPIPYAVFCLKKKHN